MLSESDIQIRNILFDFGGIITDLDKQATIDAFKRLGTDVTPYVGNYAQKGPFAALETGRITARQFADEIMKQTANGTTEENIYEAWNRMLTGIPERRLQLLRELKQHYRLFLLSNINPIHWEFSRNHLFPSLPESYFEKLYLSYECELAKPDRAIFEFFLRDSGIAAEETLFIDDSEDNCQSARALGFNVFHSRNRDDWMELFKDKPYAIHHPF